MESCDSKRALQNIRSVVLSISTKPRNAIAIVCATAPGTNPYKGRTTQNVIRTIRSIEDPIEGLRSEVLQRMLLMLWSWSWSYLEALAENIAAFLDATAIIHKVQVDFFLALRSLGGGPYLDLMAMARMSRSSIYEQIDQIVTILDRCLEINFRYEDVARFDAINAEFSTRRRSLSRG